MYIKCIMTRYEVWIVKSAEKVLDSFAVALRKRIIAKFEEVAADPRGTDSKKLDEHVYRVRVGDYRIVYEVRDKERKAIVLRIGHRKEIYK